MRAFPSRGDDAALELRRLAVNDLLGNPDAHLKKPGMIDASALPAPWRKRLRLRLRDHPPAQGLARRGT